MKRIVALLVTFAVTNISAQKSKTVKPDATGAIGTWVIDLRSTPGTKPYLKDFKFTQTDSTRFSGEFYGYPFSGPL